jgi:hypothetical protein
VKIRDQKAPKAPKAPWNTAWDVGWAAGLVGCGIDLDYKPDHLVGNADDLI